MVVKDGMNKLGRRVPLELGYAMDGWINPFALAPQCFVCLVPEP